MDDNQENQYNTDGLNSLTSQKNSAIEQGQRDNENKRINYSDLDIEESTGGSAMEDQENETIRDMDEDEI